MFLIGLLRVGIALHGYGWAWNRVWVIILSSQLHIQAKQTR